MDATEPDSSSFLDVVFEPHLSPSTLEHYPSFATNSSSCIILSSHFDMPLKD